LRLDGRGRRGGGDGRGRVGVNLVWGWLRYEMGEFVGYFIY
jgi:hypothetical protein